jgi:cytochrome P450
MIPKDGSTVDLQPLFYNLTLDSATEFLIGKSVDCQLAPEGSKAKEIAEAFDFAEGQMSARLRLGKLAIFHQSAKFMVSCRVIHEFFDAFIHEAIQDGGRETEKNNQGGRYVFVKELMKHNANPKQLRDEALNVLIAGRDTTAGLLTNLFHALARHPRVWEKLQQEISTLEGRRPGYGTLRGDMPYLKCVMNEGKSYCFFPFGLPTPTRKQRLNWE